MNDPYEILNKLFWVRAVSIADLYEMMLAHNQVPAGPSGFLQYTWMPKEIAALEKVAKGSERISGGGFGWTIGLGGGNSERYGC